MMQLFLVRHAESPFSGPTDHQRPLSEHGIKQAQATGHFIQQQLQQHRAKPQDALILCSNALRTQTTAELIQDILGTAHLLSEHSYYGALSGQWCDAICEHAAQPSLILVGHNPTISHLGQQLNPLFNHGFGPACAAHFELEIDTDGLRLPAQSIDFYTPDVN